MDIAIVALIIVGLIAGIAIWYLLENIKDLKFQVEEQRRETQTILNDKAKASAAQRSTIKGQLAEQFFPLMGACTFAPSDMRFLGDFCDYIVVDGYTRCKDEGDTYINSVTFVELKTGKSRLSRHQKLIRDAVQEGRVKWETIQL